MTYISTGHQDQASVNSLKKRLCYVSTIYYFYQFQFHTSISVLCIQFY